MDHIKLTWSNKNQMGHLSNENGPSEFIESLNDLRPHPTHDRVSIFYSILYNTVMLSLRGLLRNSLPQKKGMKIRMIS